jgi:SAM-dependent methyltransferase
MTREEKVRAQYAAAAGSWSREAYADAASYLRHRADLVRTLGPALVAGDTVLDLACGDGAMAEFLLPHGLRYVGVDASEEMVAAARLRLGDRAEVVLADLNDYAPPEPVAATTCFRAVYYARDRRAFFARVAGWTERKLVFDLNPRRYELDGIRAELGAAGLGRVELRPFFVPQTRALPGPAAALLRAAERTGPLARLALRARFSYLVSASSPAAA